MPLHDQQPGLPRQIGQKQPPLGGFFMAYPWAAFSWPALGRLFYGLRSDNARALN